MTAKFTALVIVMSTAIFAAGVFAGMRGSESSQPAPMVRVAIHHGDHRYFHYLPVITPNTKQTHLVTTVTTVTEPATSAP